MRFRALPLAVLAFAPAFAIAAYASDADFKLANKTGYQIDEVYVSPHSSDDWGNDVMGRDALASGDAVNIHFPHSSSACNFDIKVKYNDGSTATWAGVDLCSYETVSLYWDADKQVTHAVGE
jgi:hypothetical protein